MPLVRIQYLALLPKVLKTSQNNQTVCTFCCKPDLVIATVLPAKIDSGVMCCLQSYQGLISDRSLVY